MAEPTLQETTTRARFLIMSEGVAFVVLGVVAMVLPGLAAIVITVLLGWLFFFSGVVELVMTLGARTPGHQWTRLSAIVALAVGTLLIVRPVGDGAAFMAVLSLFFVLDGIFSILYAIEHRRQNSRRWEWLLASGLITLAIGALLAASPSTSVALLGELVGFDLAFAGAALVAVGFGLTVDE